MKKILFSTNKISCTLLIVIAFLLGILSLQILPPFPVISDFLDYDTVALSILNNHTYATISSDNIIYPPIYPLFLSFVYLFSGHSYGAIYLLQFILTGIIASLAYIVSKKYIGNKTSTSFLVGLTIILWPYMLLYSQLLSNEIVFMFFLSFAVLFLIKNIGAPTYKMSILSGIALGCAVLTRPVALLLPFWIFITMFLLDKVSSLRLSKETFRQGLITILVFLATISPWISYVYITYDKIIPVASNLSFVLNKANSSLEYLNTDAEKKEDTSKKETSLIKAKLMNVFLFWNPGAEGYHVKALTDKYPLSTYPLWIYKIGFIIIVLLAISTTYWIRTKKEISLLLSIIFYFWSLHTVLFPFPRYTLPIIPFVIILAFFTIEHILKYQKNV